MLSDICRSFLLTATWPDFGFAPPRSATPLMTRANGVMTWPRGSLHGILNLCEGERVQNGNR